MGASDEEDAAATETHLTGEGVAGGGGSVAGDRRVCVADKTSGGTYGGIRKCKCSSLREREMFQLSLFPRQCRGADLDLHSDNEEVDVRPRTPLNGPDSTFKFPSLDFLPD